jgi:hypothetical protein
MENNKREVLIEKSIEEFKQVVEENKRLIDVCESMKNQYDEKISYHKTKVQMAEEKLKSLISSQYSIEEMKECKTEYNIKFPSGKFSITKDSTETVKGGEMKIKLF